jgi:hypothetical protein
MTDPIRLDIPHQLGRDGARARVESRIGSLAGYIPGGGAAVAHEWQGDTMHFTVSAMGQVVASRLTVFDDRLHCEIDLPGMLSLFAGPIRAAIEREGPKLLR